MSDLVQNFKAQLNEVIDSYDEPDPKCAYAGGMLHILSSLRRYDGESIPLQIAALHKAILEVGSERGWTVGKTRRPAT